MENHYTVYKLTDPQGKIYIGCTGSSVKRRWGRGKNYQKGSPIRVAIDRYGWESFRHEILCENLTKEEAEKKENWFVEYYDSMDPLKGYNRVTGGAIKGARMSAAAKEANRRTTLKLYAEKPEIKEKIREKVKAGYAEHPERGIRHGKLMQEYWKDPGYRARNREVQRKIYAGNFERADRLRRIRKKNWEEHPERREAYRKLMQEYLSKPENRTFVESDKRAKPVICVETGELFPSQHAAEKRIGFSGVHKVCRGCQDTCGGYHWRYVVQ